MNRWIRRLSMLLIVTLWLVIMTIPMFAFVLARSGQIQIGQSEGRHWRLFLLQDAQAEGVGLERAREIALPPGAPATARCLRTTVNYRMWSGVGEDVAFCQCVDQKSGSMLSLMPPACMTP
jgi:hypothetical protein